MNLSNNSNEMRTVVETFLIEETIGLIYDNEQLDKWNSLVAELGLSGQNAITQPEKSPIPFMHLKTGLINVFETLCPRKVKVEAYNITPIPIEILELVALSKREGYFSDIEIWYDDKTPDPVCIGHTGSWYESTWYSDSNKAISKMEFSSKEAAKSAGANNPNFKRTASYILGKWADVKHSFQQLTEMATKRYVAEKGNEYKKAIKVAERGLMDLETEAFDRFGMNGSSDNDLPF